MAKNTRKNRPPSSPGPGGPAGRSGRTPRWPTALAAAGLLAAVAGGWWWLARPAPPEFVRTANQNVLLITLDTVRADVLGCYGGQAETPNLDRLAADGVRFDFAHAHAVLTLPSHASILSGLYPSPARRPRQQRLPGREGHRHGGHTAESGGASRRRRSSAATRSTPSSASTAASTCTTIGWTRSGRRRSSCWPSVVRTRSSGVR